MSHSNADASGQSNARPQQQRKRRSDAGEELRLRPAVSLHSQPSNIRAPLPSAPPMQNPLELRAYGLEDRAEAVISMGEANWSLSNLSQWRQELLHQQPQHNASAAASAQSQQSYIAQRQREYKQQMLRLRQQPPPAQ